MKLDPLTKDQSKLTFVPIKDIGTFPGLTTDDRLRLTAAAMIELAVAQSFKVIHGDRAQQRYAESGGTVRFNDEDEPCIWVMAKERKI